MEFQHVKVNMVKVLNALILSRSQQEVLRAVSAVVVQAGLYQVSLGSDTGELCSASGCSLVSLKPTYGPGVMMV